LHKLDCLCAQHNRKQSSGHWVSNLQEFHGAQQNATYSYNYAPRKAEVSLNLFVLCTENMLQTVGNRKSLWFSNSLQMRILVHGLSGNVDQCLDSRLQNPQRLLILMRSLFNNNSYPCSVHDQISVWLSLPTCILWNLVQEDNVSVCVDFCIAIFIMVHMSSEWWIRMKVAGEQKVNTSQSWELWVLWVLWVSNCTLLKHM